MSSSCRPRLCSRPPVCSAFAITDRSGMWCLVLSPARPNGGRKMERTLSYCMNPPPPPAPVWPLVAGRMSTTSTSVLGDVGAEFPRQDVDGLRLFVVSASSCTKLWASSVFAKLGVMTPRG